MSKITTDLLNESCTDISDWTDGDSGDGVSEVSPAGQFKFYSTGESWTRRYRTITTPPDTFSLEIKTYFKTLSVVYNATAAPKVSYGNSTWQLSVAFGTNGIYIYKANKASGAAGEIGTDILKQNATAAWQTWRFEVNKTTEASATVEVFLKEESGAFASQGTFDCDYETSGTDGRIDIGNTAYEAEGQNLEFYIDYIKLGTGLGEFETNGFFLFF